MHLLQQHTLDIRCTSLDFGKEVQSVLQSLLEKEFYPKLELLLNRYSSQNYTWKIDKLEIILPPLSRKKWKKWEMVKNTESSNLTFYRHEPVESLADSLS